MNTHDPPVEPGDSIGSLLERCIREVSLEVTGEVVLEVVFSDGRFRRAYVRRGPMTADQLERLRELTREQLKQLPTA